MSPSGKLPPTLTPTGHFAGKPTLPISRSVTLIGSRKQARLQLISSTVSHNHALIVNADSGPYIRDLASRMGVQVNGQQAKELPLKDGDEITIGRFTFQFNESPNAKAVVAKTPPPAPAVPGQMKVDGVEYAIPIDGNTLLIGRRESCDIHLLEDTVSTTHSIIFEMDGRRYVRDLASRTGTFVNGKQIHQIEILPGDEIRIGDTAMHYVAESGPAEAQEEIIPADLGAAPQDLADLEPEVPALAPRPMRPSVPAAAETADALELVQERSAEPEPVDEVPAELEAHAEAPVEVESEVEAHAELPTPHVSGEMGGDFEVHDDLARPEDDNVEVVHLEPEPAAAAPIEEPEAEEPKAEEVEEIAEEALGIAPVAPVAPPPIPKPVAPVVKAPMPRPLPVEEEIELAPIAIDPEPKVELEPETEPASEPIAEAKPLLQPDALPAAKGTTPITLPITTPVAQPIEETEPLAVAGIDTSAPARVEPLPFDAEPELAVKPAMPAPLAPPAPSVKAPVARPLTPPPASPKVEPARPKIAPPAKAAPASPPLVRVPITPIVSPATAKVAAAAPAAAAASAATTVAAATAVGAAAATVAGAAASLVEAVAPSAARLSRHRLRHRPSVRLVPGLSKPTLVRKPPTTPKPSTQPPSTQSVEPPAAPKPVPQTPAAPPAIAPLSVETFKAPPQEMPPPAVDLTAPVPELTFDEADVVALEDSLGISSSLSQAASVPAKPAGKKAGKSPGKSGGKSAAKSAGKSTAKTAAPMSAAQPDLTTIDFGDIPELPDSLFAAAGETAFDMPPLTLNEEGEGMVANEAEEFPLDFSLPAELEEQPALNEIPFETEEEPAAEAAEAPVAEAPLAESPVEEVPVADETVDESTVETADEAVTEESAPEESTAQEPVAEESIPVAPEEQAIAEPVAEESHAEEEPAPAVEAETELTPHAQPIEVTSEEIETAETIAPTEATPESAQALEDVLDEAPSEENVEPPIAEQVGTLESVELSDSSFGRAVNEFTGESTGPIVDELEAPQPPPSPPAPLPPSTRWGPGASQLDLEPIEPDEPSLQARYVGDEAFEDLEPLEPPPQPAKAIDIESEEPETDVHPAARDIEEIEPGEMQLERRTAFTDEAPPAPTAPAKSERLFDLQSIEAPGHPADEEEISLDPIESAAEIPAAPPLEEHLLPKDVEIDHSALADDEIEIEPIEMDVRPLEELLPADHETPAEVDEAPAAPASAAADVLSDRQIGLELIEPAALVEPAAPAPIPAPHPVAEAPPVSPTSVAPSTVPPVSSAAPPAAPAPSRPAGGEPFNWGANQEHFFGGMPLRLTPLTPKPPLTPTVLPAAAAAAARAASPVVPPAAPAAPVPAAEAEDDMDVVDIEPTIEPVDEQIEDAPPIAPPTARPAAPTPRPQTPALQAPQPRPVPAPSCRRPQTSTKR